MLLSSQFTITRSSSAQLSTAGHTERRAVAGAGTTSKKSGKPSPKAPPKIIATPKQLKKSGLAADLQFSRPLGAEAYREWEVWQAGDVDRAEDMGPSQCESDSSCGFFLGATACLVTVVSCVGAAAAAGGAVLTTAGAAVSAGASSVAATYSASGVTGLCYAYCNTLTNLVDDLFNPTPVPKPAGEIGSFSVVDRSGFPDPDLFPSGPLRLVEGEEYAAARAAGNEATRQVRRDASAAGVDPSGMDVHHIQPVKFGGSPTDPGNLLLIPHEIHQELNIWWSRLQRSVQQGGIGRG